MVATSLRQRGGTLVEQRVSAIDQRAPRLSVIREAVSDGDHRYPGDLEDLRNRLADRLDDHPVREWSAPLLVAIIGILDANALSRELALSASESPLSGLRLVN